MSGGRWGQSRWAEGKWGASEVGVNHSLASRVGMAVQGSALRLGANHRLETLALSPFRCFGAGLGPAPIHPLLAESAVMVVSATGSALQKIHNLSAVPTITLDASAASLKRDHKLVSVATILSGGTARLRIFHPLEALARFEGIAAASNLAISHPLSVTALFTFVNAGRYTIEIPELLPPELVNPDDVNSVVPGTINLVLNPSAENGLTGWLPVGDALVSLDTLLIWDLVNSVRVEFVDLSAGEGVSIRTAYPLGLAAQGGSVLWGQAAVASDDAPVVSGWVEVNYTDGTIDAGELLADTEITGTGADGDWQVLLFPPISPDAGKVVESARLVIVEVTAAIGDSLNVGGVQIEYDRWMMGPTPIRTDVMVIASEIAV